MKKTLYDLLEVNSTATQDSIHSSFHKLSAKHDPNLAENIGSEDARVRYNLIKDAFFTLGDADRRQRYDLSLSSEVAVAQLPKPRDFWSWENVALIFLIALVSYGYYSHHEHEKAKLQHEQLQLKQSKI